MNSDNRPTQPFAKGKTTPFGDAFVGGSGKPPDLNATRPLPNQPTSNLGNAVQNRLGEIQKELDYIRHLTSLFAAPVAVLKAGVQISDLKGELAPAPLVDEALLEMPCTACRQIFDGTEAAGICSSCGSPFHVGCWLPPCPIEGCGQSDFMTPEEPLDSIETIVLGFGPEQSLLARGIGQELVSNPKVKQRAQVCLFQYEEAYRAYQSGTEVCQEALQLPPAEAWEKIQEVGIERIKGKAYAICGFYENFKSDGALSRVFPPPKNKPLDPAPRPATRPLSSSAPTAPPARSPVGDDDDEPLAIEHAIGGLIGKIKGLFK